MTIRWEAAGGTDVGRIRRGNEDSFFVDAPRGVFLVADGMGGHAAGEIASALAAEAVGKALVEAIDAGQGGDDLLAALRDGIATAHDRIVRCCADEPRTRGMGTTLTACTLTPAGAYHIGHIGDSRAYRLRNARLEQLTSDHTLVQREVDAGRLSPDAARVHPLSHILSRVLSTDAWEEPDLLAGVAEPGDFFLLTSDGLTGMLDDAEIARILGSALPLPGLVDALIRAANARGGTDNITAVVVQILPGEPG